MHAADGTGAFYIKTAATRLAEVQTVKQTDLLADLDVAKNHVFPLKFFHSRFPYHFKMSVFA